MSTIGLLVLLAIVVYNVREGTMGQWFEAKFLGRGATPPNKKRYATAGSKSVGGTAGAIGADKGNGPAGMVNVNGAWLSPGFAAIWRPVVEAARRAGINLTGGGWRSSVRQQELREAHCPDPVNSPASECTPPTAKVGTSLHETGDAIDLTGVTSYSHPTYRWLAANAARFGITAPVSGEPWHWQAA